MAPRPGPSAGRRPGPTRGAAFRAAARRSAARTPAAPRRRQGLTTRAAVLGLVVCGVLLSAAVPLREYLAQRGEIRSAEQAQAHQRQRVAALQAQQTRLQDPAYVMSQARTRFGYVMPGETNYVVLRPGAPAPAVPDEGPVTPTGPGKPWYAQLWGSVRAADQAPAPR